MLRRKRALLFAVALAATCCGRKTATTPAVPTEAPASAPIGAPAHTQPTRAEQAPVTASVSVAKGESFDTAPTARPSPIDYKNLKPTSPKAFEGITDGRILFTNNCASCHGADGRAAEAPDLSRASVQDRLSDEELEVLLAKGHKQTAKAPRLAGLLSSEQLRALVSYVRGLKAS